MSTVAAATFAASAVALYAAHHAGDYWVQTDHDAAGKGGPGWAGRLACLRHVATYTLTQAVFLILTAAALDLHLAAWGVAPALLVSAGTHYLADRRDHGLMFWLARRIPGKERFLKLGVPRPARQVELWGPCSTCEGRGTSYDESTGGKCWDCRGGGQLPGHLELTDNPSLGTGGWALDQAWHIVLGVWLPALIVAAAA
jgi:hypothetical protein